jgi:hypothetical protein
MPTSGIENIIPPPRCAVLPLCRGRAFLKLGSFCERGMQVYRNTGIQFSMENPTKWVRFVKK